MHECVIDIETYQDIPDWVTERWLEDNPEPPAPERIVKDDIRPPKTWKDPDKIAEYKRKEWASRTEKAEQAFAKAMEKRAAGLKAFEEKAALSPLTGRIVAVGLAVRDQADGVSWTHGAFVDSGQGEAALLQRVDETLAEIRPSLLVSYFGRRFDFPYLAIRSMKHRLTLAQPWPLGKWSKRHIDMWEAFGQGKLDDWARLLTDQAKVGDGADVAGMVEQGRWDDLENYAAQDALVTAHLWDMYRLTVNWGEGGSIAMPQDDSLPF